MINPSLNFTFQSHHSLIFNESLFLSFHLFTASKSSKFADIVNLHIRADLRCLKVFIRGQKARISEISIEGKEALQTSFASLNRSPSLLQLIFIFCEFCLFCHKWFCMSSVSNQWATETSLSLLLSFFISSGLMMQLF